MTLYLSGRMRGQPNFAFDLFHEVAAQLRARGHFVFNPAEHDEAVYPNIRQWSGFASGDTEKCPQFNLPTSLAWDFSRIIDADGIALLPGWEQSSGAKAERFVAEVMGREVWVLSKEKSGYWNLLRDYGVRIAYPQLKEPA